ncbi:hypothetical protein WNY37_13635 [Henriciella sp. AS95]|uniref:hypothetical protein n=1 Tax=Henriciella sp. AS95 TaxID=3135782 RepID=UPI00317F3163
MTDTTADRNLGWPVLASLAGAAFLLIFWILPAEHGIDPTGFGKLTGLTSLTAEEEHAFEAADAKPVTITESFELLGFESLEYKVDLDEHAGMVFSWSASAPLHYDMHAEPSGAEDGEAYSYAAGDAARQDGTYLAEFQGEHGWYWANETAEPITVELSVTGFFAATTLYRDGNAISQSMPKE